METGTLYNADCIRENGMCRIETNSIDLILCDLPYATTSLAWDSIIPFEPLWAEYERIIKDNGAIVLTASQPFTSALVMSKPELFKYELIWEKSKASDFINANYRPMKKHENILVFSKGGAAPGCLNPMPYYPQGIIYKEKKRVRRGTLGIGRDRDSQQGEYISKATNYPTSLLPFKNEGKTIHPTQKPVALFEYLIRTFSREGDLVLDNCMGSGTTAIAAIKSNRRFIGFERDAKIFRSASERISKYFENFVNMEAI